MNAVSFPQTPDEKEQTLSKVFQNSQTFLSLKQIKKKVYTDAALRKSVEQLYGAYFVCKQNTLSVRQQFRCDIASKLIENKYFLPELVQYIEEILDDALNSRLMDSQNKINAMLEYALRMALLLLMNYSDASKEFSTACSNLRQLWKAMVRIQMDWKVPYFEGSLHERACEIIRYSITIPYNVLTHKILGSVGDLRESGLVESIKPYLQTDSERLRVTTLLFFAYIATEEESETCIAPNSSIGSLMTRLYEARHSELGRSGGMSVREILQGLDQLAKHDANKKSLVDAGLLTAVMDIMNSDQISDEAVLVTIQELLWTLSFDQEICEDIQRMIPSIKKLEPTLNKVPVVSLTRNKPSEGATMGFGSVPPPPPPPGNAPCQESITNFAASPVTTSVKETELSDEANKSSGPVFYSPQQREKLLMSQKKAMEGIFWNVNSMKGSPRSGTPAGTTQLSDSSHIMVSYEWGSKPIVERVVKSLKERNYKIWFDESDMGDNTLDSMAEAVEKSFSVIICYSLNYKNSQNCRSEAQYAYRLSKPIIPVRVEKDYKPDGWLGIILGTKTYYDFSGKYPFNDKFKELIISVERLKGNKGEVKEETLTKDKHFSLTSSASIESKSMLLDNWTDDTLAEWYQKNSIKKPDLSQLSLKRLLFLLRIRNKAPEYYYRILTKELHCDLDSVILLDEAISQLKVK